jgi:hypothetical protein
VLAEKQVTAHFDMIFKIDDYCRVVAKTAFNCLAFIKGSAFMLEKIFDPIRYAIYTGIGISQYVSWADQKEFLLDLSQLLQISKFGNNSHVIIIYRVGLSLRAVVCFYGLVNPLFVTLTNGFDGYYNETDGIICDWENKKEMRFSEFISEICGK